MNVTLLFRAVQKDGLGHFLRNIFFGQKTQVYRSADEKIVFLYPAQFALMSRSFLRIDFAYRCFIFYNIVNILSRQLIYKWTSRKSRPHARIFMVLLNSRSRPAAFYELILHTDVSYFIILSRS